MEILTDDAFVLIFELLDDDSMMQAMKVCARWLQIFSTSQPLLRKFHFEVTGNNINQVVIPNVPIKNLSLRNISIQNNSKNLKSITKSHFQEFADEIQIIVSHVRENLSLNQIAVEESDDESDDESWTIYETISFRQKNRPPTVKFGVLINLMENFEFLESLKLEKVNFNNNFEFYEVLKDLKLLNSLKLIKCELYNLNLDVLSLNFKNLRSISFEKCNFNFLTASKVFENLENVKVVNHDDTFSGFCHNRLNELLESLKNVKTLSLEGRGTSSYFDNENFPYKIQKLEAESLTFDFSSKNPRLNFLKSQKGFLKNLKLKKFPHNFDGGEIMKFIFEEMNLENFCCGEINLIKIRRKNEKVEELWMCESQSKAGIEILKHFPKFKLKFLS